MITYQRFRKVLIIKVIDKTKDRRTIASVLCSRCQWSTGVYTMRCSLNPINLWTLWLGWKVSSVTKKGKLIKGPINSISDGETIGLAGKGISSPFEADSFDRNIQKCQCELSSPSFTAPTPSLITLRHLLARNGRYYPYVTANSLDELLKLCADEALLSNERVRGGTIKSQNFPDQILITNLFVVGQLNRKTYLIKAVVERSEFVQKQNSHLHQKLIKVRETAKHSTRGAHFQRVSVTRNNEFIPPFSRDSVSFEAGASNEKAKIVSPIGVEGYIYILI
ncbi:hypothetical protein RF11_09022 [Thelohanellus kitauei]|uniref:Uncharacterized protein n=1 Tax=Thelohanellus kitauei TaxID=669202 RepID=A0A0C2N755_THEKT|nr:hypothetical protein RF11_09022 [Thelohanellus kitauei]